MTVKDDALLGEQAAYYRARAPEYDEWWQRLGRYDRGPEATANWQRDITEVERSLDTAQLSGNILELASGTGWWTERLARRATTLTCLDASPETIAINRRRIEAAGLPIPEYRQVDLFAWEPDTQYDAIFFSFWLSHVPEDRFDAFWAAVAKALRPGGRVFLIDSAPEEMSRAIGHPAPDADGVQERLLKDGRSFRIVKLFHDPDALNARLAALGWSAHFRPTSRYFIHGVAQQT